MSKRITSRSITDEQAIEIALRINWTMSPTSDLCMAIRQKFRCSDNVAEKIYSRILDQGLIRQIHKTEWAKIPPSSMAFGTLSVPECRSKWERTERKEN